LIISSIVKKSTRTLDIPKVSGGFGVGQLLRAPFSELPWAPLS